MTPKSSSLPFTGLKAPAARLATLGLFLGLGLLPLTAAAQSPALPPAGSPASGIAAPPAASAAPVEEAGTADGPGTAAFANMAARMDNLQSEIDALNGHIQVIDHELQQISKRLDQMTQSMPGGANSAAPGAAPGTAPGVVPFGAAPNQRSSAEPGQGAPGTAGPATTGPTTAGNQDLGPLRSPPPHPLGELPANAPLPQPQSQEAPQGAGQQGRGEAAAPASETAVTLPRGSAETQYKYATDFLRRGDYGKAGQAFAAFLKAHPKHPLASNAQYWLGETYYVRQLYAQSAATFLAGYRQDPHGDKAPADLLKLGMSLMALKKPQEACAVFKQLETQYPHAEPRIKQYAARERERAKCS